MVLACLIPIFAGCGDGGFIEMEKNEVDVVVSDYDRFADNTKLVFGESGYPCKSEDILYDFDLKPDSEELYESFDKGISFGVPYNEGWGRGKYFVPPFAENDDRILFGPLLYAGGPCFMVSNLEVELLESVDRDLFIENSMEYIGVNLNDAEVDFEKKEILGMELVSFVSGAFCESSSYVLFGDKYNYYFKDPGCSATLTDEFFLTVELL